MVTLKKLPPIGARIIKSALAVMLCMAVYFIRTLLPVANGIPFYSALAALWCMQPYADKTKNNAWQRLSGTIIGAVFGLAFLIAVKCLDLREATLVYLSASVLIVPVIYSTVVLDKRTASFFSCVVFLSIALTHSFDEDPYIFVFNRVIDTFIGILIGVAVNDFRLPIRYPDSRTLYISGIDDVLVSSDSHTASFSKVELNRLIKNGIKFTISTVRTPAELISIMKGVELELPVIVMDGAAIYDIKEKQYIETIFLPQEICAKAERIIAESGLHCFVNTMYDSTLLIFYGELKNSAEKDLFETHRHSPFRNYIRSSYRHNDGSEKVLYLTVLAEDADISGLEERLREKLGDTVKITVSPSEYSGFSYIKVFSDKASKQEMIKKLKEYVGADKTVTFGSIEGEYDVYVGDGGGNATVKRLKRIHRSEFLNK